MSTPRNRAAAPARPIGGVPTAGARAAGQDRRGSRKRRAEGGHSRPSGGRVHPVAVTAAASQPAPSATRQPAPPPPPQPAPAPATAPATAAAAAGAPAASRQRRGPTPPAVQLSAAPPMPPASTPTPTPAPAPTSYRVPTPAPRRGGAKPPPPSGAPPARTPAPAPARATQVGAAGGQRQAPPPARGTASGAGPATTGRFLPFADALAVARSFGLTNSPAWYAHCKGGACPTNVPTNPHRTYSKHGWQGWGHWLGTGNLQCSKQQFLPYAEAAALVRPLGLASRTAWQVWCRENARPQNVPYHPNLTYKNAGWKEWGHWLGTGYTRAPPKSQLLPFGEALEVAQSLGLASEQEWAAWWKEEGTGILEGLVPADPRTAYLHTGWQGWDHWLATGNTRAGGAGAAQTPAVMATEAPGGAPPAPTPAPTPARTPAPTPTPAPARAAEGAPAGGTAGMAQTAPRRAGPPPSPPAGASPTRKHPHTPTLAPARAAGGAPAAGGASGTAQPAPKRAGTPPDPPVGAPATHEHPQTRTPAPARAASAGASGGAPGTANPNAPKRADVPPPPPRGAPPARAEGGGAAGRAHTWVGQPGAVGSGKAKAKSRAFLPFAEALAAARALGLASAREWKAWCKEGRRPPTLPAQPGQVYTDVGWEGWGHWLGTANIKGGADIFLPFNEALVVARSLGMSSSTEWRVRGAERWL